MYSHCAAFISEWSQEVTADEANQTGLPAASTSGAAFSGVCFIRIQSLARSGIYRVGWIADSANGLKMRLGKGVIERGQEMEEADWV